MKGEKSISLNIQVDRESDDGSSIFKKLPSQGEESASLMVVLLTCQRSPSLSLSIETR